MKDDAFFENKEVKKHIYMKIPSVTDFIRSLASPAEHFATLPDFTVETCGGRAVVNRTSLFAEARIEIDGEPFMLCLPVRPESMSEIEPALFLLRRAGGGGAVGCRILSDEYSFVDEWGHLCRCDLLLHPLPEGELLNNAVTHFSRSTLLQALEQLRAEFLRCGVRHRNLKPSNLVFGSDGRLRAIRCYYLVSESEPAAIEAEFAAVKEYIEEHSDECDDQQLARIEAELLCGFDEIFPPSDMMRMVRRGELYGFVDAEGRMAVEPQFTYAERFCENRAIVECGRGHQGVIDRCGNYILEPVFDMVYRTGDGNFRVLRNRMVGEFGYLGEELVPMQPGQFNN